MVNQANLQMTYIPNADEQGKFIIWSTSEDDCPVSMSADRFVKLLKRSKIGRSLLTEETATRKMIVEWEEEHIEVQGLLVDMWRVFLLFQKEVPLHRPFGAFTFGDTFQYWETIAKSIGLLIENGHYYPTLLAVEKEGNHFLYAQWLLGRKTIEEGNLFHEWLRIVSYNIFSVSELASFSIREWQNLLLDTWTDQIIRTLVEPTFSDHLEHWPDSEMFASIVPKWFYYLLHKDNSFFQVIEKREEMMELHAIQRKINAWHKPISGQSYSKLEDNLKDSKKHFIQTGFKPQKLLLHCFPFSISKAFDNDRDWDINLEIEGVENGETTSYSAQDLQIRKSYAKKWLQEKLDHIIQIDETFYPLSLHKVIRTFEINVPTRSILKLNHHAELLQAFDIELTFPYHLKWKTIDKDDFKMNLKVESESPASFRLDSLLQFNWQIAIGDIELSLQEFKELVESEQSFMKRGTEWIELPFEQMVEAYNELKEIDTDIKKKSSMSNLLHVYLKNNNRFPDHIDVQVEKHTENYLNRLLEQPADAAEIPNTLLGNLRPYQIKGFHWLNSLKEKQVGGCLADDMGLGKTIQTITYLLTAIDSGKRSPTLIICPTSVIENWKQELNRFAPSLRIYIHHGPDRMNGETFALEKENIDIVITSYNLMVRDSKWLTLENWRSVILDEAQNIKNPQTKQSQLIRKLNSEHRLALTGTPMENKLEELWSIMEFLNPGYLGSLRSFRQQFITPIEKHEDRSKLEMLRKLVQPFLLRRTKTDPNVIQDLPEKIEKKEFCFLSKEQASVYQSVVNNLMEKMTNAVGIERKGLILATLTKLKQVCDHPYLVAGQSKEAKISGKLEHFFDLINPIMEHGEKSLVFTQYVGMGELVKECLQRKYQDCHVFFLHGAIPSIKRTEMIEQFRQIKNEKCVFILSIKAGGVGLNLTEANHVFHIDRWWNPAVENQATDRAYRIGQKQNVYVYKMITKGTLEEGIDQLIDRKKSLTEQIIGSGDGWVTEMNDDEVYDLIRLREQVLL
jgi:SNF2 family DNA or RNA helicase